MMEYFKIGQIIAVHGTSGTMILKHALGNESRLMEIRSVFLEENKDAFIPWFVKNIKIRSDNELFINLEEVTTREEARLLLKKEVWLAEQDFAQAASGNSPISLLNYEMIEQGKSLGVIREVVEQSFQILCKVIIREKEVWIPIHEKSLIKIDRGHRQVWVRLPDGLLEVYLQ